MFWQKVWIFLKSYWYLPVILILIVILSIFLRKGNPALDLLNNAIDSYKKQIEEMNRLNQEKEKAKAELEAKYQLVLKQIEENYSLQGKLLDEEKKKRVKELVNQYKDDPEMMASAFANEFHLSLGK